MAGGVRVFMGIISRLLLLLYVLAVMAVLVVSAGVCLHFIPTQVWQDNLSLIISRQETLIVIAVMLLASLCLLSMSLSSSKKATIVNLSGDVELQKGTFKEVSVSIPAIISVVERAALSVAGVRQVEAKVQNKGGNAPVNVQLSIILSQNYSAPEVSAEIKTAVNKALQVALEISDVPVDMKVSEITHAVIERERRVV
jgi:uncharacterized alkaline shock family protein YloU